MVIIHGNHARSLRACYSLYGFDGSSPHLMPQNWRANIGHKPDSHPFSPQRTAMPTLSIFFGIIVRMWHDDHPPPHIHVAYQGFEALVEIATGEINEGNLPRKVASIVKEWCLTHQTELQDNWQRAQGFELLDRIQGADRD